MYTERRSLIVAVLLATIVTPIFPALSDAVRLLPGENTPTTFVRLRIFPLDNSYPLFNVGYPFVGCPI